MARKTKKQKRKVPAAAASVARTEVGKPLDEDAAERIKKNLDAERQSLDVLRTLVEAARAQLVADTESLDEREADLDQRESQCKAGENELADKKRRFDKDAQELRKRERDIIRREQEAERGFARAEDKALATLNGLIKERRAALKKLEDDLARRRIADHEALDSEIARERTSRLESLAREMAEKRAAAEAELAEKRATAEKKLAREREEADRDAERRRRERMNEDKRLRDLWDHEQTALKQERERLREEAGELRREQQQVKLDRTLLAADEDALHEKIAERARAAVSDLERQVRERDETIESMARERSRLHDRVRLLREEAQQFGDKSPDDVFAEMRALEEDVERLEEALHRRPSAEAGQRLEELESERRAWDKMRGELQREIAELKGERHTWLLEQAELERVRERAEIAERRRDSMVTQMEYYSAEVQRLQGLFEPTQEKSARIGVIEKPVIPLPTRASDDFDGDELAWLARIQAECENAGMYFPERLLHAFHTSLKCAEWSALTVLAGVSGTGKSELPRLYSRFGGLAYLPLAVEPNWDSPQSLFGFFNSVDNRFNATTLLRALVQSQRAPDDPEYRDGFDDCMLLVLLDEMNLAHVELYFSAMLSKLEDRRGKREGETALDIDLGAGMDPYPLPLGRNVLWTGTMNEDATTKSLSDKVLDRSNLLVFPRPQTFRRRAPAELPAQAPLLARAQWQTWIKNGPTLDEQQLAPYKTWLEDVNERLSVVGRALGHRVWQSIEAYMGAHPRVVATFQAEEPAERRRALRLAFEDAVVHKVMPKLRGIETDGKAGRECLQPIQTLLEDDDLGLSLSRDFQVARTVGHGAFIWCSAHYLTTETDGEG